MTEAKKPRPMTEKRFATSKLSGKTTAEGFLTAHRDFLRGHDFLHPILDAYEQKELLPTPTLQAIQSALMTHVLESEKKTQQAKLAQQQTHTGKPRKGNNGYVSESKPYSITLMCKVFTDRQLSQFNIEVGTITEVVGYRIRTAKGDVVVETKEEADGHLILEKISETKPAVWAADDFGAAMRLADRRLFQREDSVYAIIRNNYGTPIDTHVPRGDAVARILRKPKGPTSHTRGRSTKTLGFQPHAKQSRVTGPWSHR